jgi:hypothetical protein
LRLAMNLLSYQTSADKPGVEIVEKWFNLDLLARVEFQGRHVPNQAAPGSLAAESLLTLIMMGGESVPIKDAETIERLAENLEIELSKLAPTPSDTP